MSRAPLHALTWSAEQSLYELYTQGQLEQRFRSAEEAAWLACSQSTEQLLSIHCEPHLRYAQRGSWFADRFQLLARSAGDPDLDFRGSQRSAQRSKGHRSHLARLVTTRFLGCDTYS